MRFAFRSILFILLFGAIGGVVAWMISRERAATEARNMAIAQEEMVRLRTVAQHVSERFPPGELEPGKSGSERIRAAIDRTARQDGVPTQTVAADLRAFLPAISATGHPSLEDQCLAHFADSDFARVVELSRAKLSGPDASSDVALLSGHAFSALGKDAEAAAAYRIALRALGTGSGLAWARVGEHFAAALARAGNQAEGLEVWRQVLAIRTREQGGGHPETLAASIATERLKLQMSVPAERDGILRALIVDLDARDGPDAEELPAILDQLGDSVRSQGNASEAESLYRRALNISGKTDESPSQAQRLFRVASLLVEQGRLAEAEPFMRRAVELTKQRSGPMSSSASDAVDRLAKLLRARGERDQAEQILRDEMTALADAGTPPDLRLAGHLFELACVMQDAGRSDEAEPLLRRAVTLAQTAEPPAWEQEIAWSGMLARLLQV
ncbi:MAG: tetratricopeptide repeat protein, partial [Chthoniobacteraceae bacterium]